MPAPHRGSILVVEDHESTRQSIVYILQQAGHLVVSTATGTAALQHLAASSEHRAPFDVVLTDLLLHDITGIDILRVARGLADPPEVILLTGYGTLNSAIEAMRAGAFDYLLKPSTPEAMLDCLNNALKRRNDLLQQRHAIQMIEENLQRLRGPGDSGQGDDRGSDLSPHPAGGRLLRVGALVIDQIAHTITFADQPIAVTPIEYEILRILVEAQGGMVTYQSLVARIYKQQLPAYEAQQLLKTHMHNLRGKIDRRCLINVRSIGYRIVRP